MPKCTPQKVKKYFKDKFSISVSTVINCYYRVNYLRYAELSLGVWCTTNQLCLQPGLGARIQPKSLTERRYCRPYRRCHACASRHGLRTRSKYDILAVQARAKSQICRVHSGLPPVYGLYTAITPLLVYAILGTSRQMAVGPVAIVSLLLTAGTINTCYCTNKITNYTN
jgi:hypothetical protein